MSEEHTINPMRALVQTHNKEEWLKRSKSMLLEKLNLTITHPVSYSSYSITPTFSPTGAQYILDCTMREDERSEGEDTNTTESQIEPHVFYFYIDLVRGELINSIYILSKEEEELVRIYLNKIKLI